MSIRTKVLGLVDVMMRVPPILVIDEILKISMGLPTRFYPANTDSSDDAKNPDAAAVNVDSAKSFAIGELIETTSTMVNSTLNSAVSVAITNASLEEAIENARISAASGGMLSGNFNVLMEELAHDSNISNVLSLTSVKFIICLIGFLCAASIFMLWTRHLVMVYMFVISLALTFLSYWSNVSALALMAESPCILEELLTFNTTRILDTGGIVMSLMPHLVAQWFMGTLFAYIHLGPRYTTLQNAMPLIFASPILCGLLPLPKHILRGIPAVADVVPLMLAQISLMSSTIEAAKTVYNGYQYAMSFVSNFGLSALIENEWQRLNVPTVLRVFWTLRIAQEFITIMRSDGIAGENIDSLGTMRKLLVDGCETLTAVLGMTSVISIICHYIGKAFQWFLLTFDNDEEKSLGTVSAVLFYILALQTGLTSLSPDKRFVRLCRNLCLLITALLHFLHNIVSPILMSLSAARNPSRKRHTRALAVCAFLIFAPVGLLMVLWSRHAPSTWLLAVTAFSIEVIVKVLVSLSTYTLFLLDARRQTFWEKLDDYLYYVRAFGNSVEFFFAILLLFNGAWILLFESGGAIRAIMMCIHAYFNIWCEARAGWSVFMKRRSAVHKISALPEATPAQLSAFDDVCAICYQEMYSAKITRCRHYFHGVCLRKWLYVQDRCPLCHEIMMSVDREDGHNAAAQPQNAAAAAAPPLQDNNNADMQQQLAPQTNLPQTAVMSSNASTTSITGQSATSESSSTQYSTAVTDSTASSTSATAAAAAVATAAASNTAGASAANAFSLPTDIAVHD